MTKTIFSITMLALSVGCSGGDFESEGNESRMFGEAMGGAPLFDEIDQEPVDGEEEDSSAGSGSGTGGAGATGGSNEETGGSEATGGSQGTENPDVICMVQLPTTLDWFPPEESYNCNGDCPASFSTVWTAPQKIRENVWGVQWVRTTATISGDVTAWNGSELATEYDGVNTLPDKNFFEITFGENGQVASIENLDPFAIDSEKIIGSWSTTPSNALSLQFDLDFKSFSALNNAELTCK